MKLRTVPPLLLAIAALLLCTACATDVNYSTIRAPTALAGQRVANLKRGTLDRPFRVAIAPPLRGSGSYRNEDRAAWSKDERVVIDRWVETAKSAGILLDAVYLPRFLVSLGEEQTDPLGDSVRAAQLAGADAVLLLQTAAGSNAGGNVLSLLYLTIVGMWIVPGTSVRASAIVEGVLVGADGATLYAFGEGLSKRSTVIPQAYHDPVVEEERTLCLALDELGKRLLEMAKPN
ncbi:MAG: hypothetical protein IT457_23695 [Planctomycetes bacterium]|nr:hypothetical protein [Planctomycetota bacterium]